MTTATGTTEYEYNVFCRACSTVWRPGIRTPLWWKAKKHAEAGYLGALSVSGVECDCIKPVCEPEAPLRVFGYDDMCEDFDIPYYSFTDAVRKFRKLHANGGYVVFISGVSPKVETMLNSL